MAGVVLLTTLTMLALQGAALAAASNATGSTGHRGSARFATFNASLNRAADGELVADLSTPDDVQAQAVADVIQRLWHDVLLINEFDFDPRAWPPGCSSTTTTYRSPTEEAGEAPLDDRDVSGMGPGGLRGEPVCQACAAVAGPGRVRGWVAAASPPGHPGGWRRR
jgi:hypothetical protein